MSCTCHPSELCQNRRAPFNVLYMSSIGALPEPPSTVQCPVHVIHRSFARTAEHRSMSCNVIHRSFAGTTKHTSMSCTCHSSELYQNRRAPLRVLEQCPHELFDLCPAELLRERSLTVGPPVDDVRQSGLQHQHQLVILEPLGNVLVQLWLAGGVADRRLEAIGRPLGHDRQERVKKGRVVGGDVLKRGDIRHHGRDGRVQ